MNNSLADAELLAACRALPWGTPRNEGDRVQFVGRVIGVRVIGDVKHDDYFAIVRLTRYGNQLLTTEGGTGVGHEE